MAFASRCSIYVAHAIRRASVFSTRAIFWRSFTASNSNTMDVADLSDAYDEILQYVEPGFKNFGGKSKFGGLISTVKCHEDNVMVKKTLGEPGKNRVLVVDGGGSLRCALLGDNLARLAIDNNWAGVVVNGCIRDSGEVATMAVGVKALGTMPKKSIKKGVGDRDIPVRFGGVTFTPGDFLYSDIDGIIVSPKELTLPPPKL